MSPPSPLNIDTHSSAARSMPSPAFDTISEHGTFTSSSSISSSSSNYGPMTPPWQDDGSLYQRSTGSASVNMNRRPSLPVGWSSDSSHPPPLPPIRHPLWRLECNSCSAVLCEQAMQGHLVGDPSKKLFSTNQAIGVLGLPDRPISIICPCKFHLFACASCGSVCGYNLSQPCAGCESNRGNGHFWIFYAHEIVAHWRTTKESSEGGSSSSSTSTSASSSGSNQDDKNMFWDDLPTGTIKSFANVGR